MNRRDFLRAAATVPLVAKLGLMHRGPVRETRVAWCGGVWLGQDRFHIDSPNSFVSWDGHTFTIKGTLNV